MPRDPKSRDITLNSLALITGGLTAAAFLGTGWVTGLAADYTAQKAEAKALTTAAAAAAAPVTADPAPQPVATPRPTRTVVTTRVVQAKSPVYTQQFIPRSSGRVSTVRASTRFAAAPAPQRSAPRAVAPAPSAAS